MPSREEQRELGEIAKGDLYMNKQESDKPSPFVVQMHVRGIFTDSERLALLKKPTAESLRKAGCEYLNGSVQEFTNKLDKADASEDISSIQKQFIVDVPDDFDIAKVINRGNSHHDLRIHPAGEKHLIGWTITAPRFAVQLLKTGNILFPGRDKLLANEAGDKIPSVKKAKQPVEWLTLVTNGKKTYEADAGEVGATPETGGKFFFNASGSLLFGVQKDDYHELFLRFDPPYSKLSGRWGFQKIAGSPSYNKVSAQWWMMDKVYENPAPYIIHYSREAKEKQAKEDGIKQIIWNAKTLSLLKSLDFGKQLLEGIDKEKIDEKIAEYSNGGGVWEA
jgi:hypothetical protein